MNKDITFSDAKNLAFKTIQDLRDKKLDKGTAKEIKGLLDVIIEAGKTEVSFLNAIPKHIKDDLSKENVLTIANTLRDHGAELDETFNEIEEENKKPYELS